jgi:Mg-chelatase subunit ChlD
MSKPIDVYSVMEGMSKYVMSGAVPGLTNVVYHEAGQGAFTDGNTIHLPRPDSLSDDTALLLWRYYAEHEMGHEDPINAKPHWKTVMLEWKPRQERKEKYIDKLFFTIANIISDHVQERNRIGVMRGRDEVLLRGRLAFMQSDFGSPAAKAQDDALMGLGCWDWEARKEWNPYIAAAVDIPTKQGWKVAPAKGRNFASAVRLSDLKNEADVFASALVIRKLFSETEAEEASKRLEVAGAGKGTPDDHDAKTRAGKRGEIVPAPTFGGHKAKEGSYAPRIPRTLREATGTRSISKSGYRAKIVEMLHKTNLPAKVRAFLMARKVAKYRTGYRSGRLDTNRLTEVLRGKDDIFRRREDVRMVNTAVSLLVDASGSMGGDKYTHACAAAIMMAEALQGIGVDVEIAGFTEFGYGDNTLCHEIATPFGQRFVKERALDVFDVLGSNLYENADGESILYAYSRLKKQQQPKKILIVLSDGSPAATPPPGSTASVHTFTRDVIKQIEADKSVHLWAIGIHYDPTMYKQRVVLEHRGGISLEEALLNLTKKLVGGVE